MVQCHGERNLPVILTTVRHSDAPGPEPQRDEAGRKYAGRAHQKQDDGFWAPCPVSHGERPLIMGG